MYICILLIVPPLSCNAINLRNASLRSDNRSNNRDKLRFDSHALIRAATSFTARSDESRRCLVDFRLKIVLYKTFAVYRTPVVLKFLFSIYATSCTFSMFEPRFEFSIRSSSLCKIISCGFQMNLTTPLTAGCSIRFLKCRNVSTGWINVQKKKWFCQRVSRHLFPRWRIRNP